MPATFPFSSNCHVPHLVPKRCAIRIALLNITFLVPDDDTRREHIIFGLTVRRHIGIDLRTLLDRKWSALEGTDFAGVDGNATINTGGRIGFLIVARMRNSDEEEATEQLLNRPRPN